MSAPAAFDVQDLTTEWLTAAAEDRPEPPVELAEPLPADAADSPAPEPEPEPEPESFLQKFLSWLWLLLLVIALAVLAVWLSKHPLRLLARDAHGGYRLR